VHSPLFVQIVNDRLWNEPPQEDRAARRSVAKKRIQRRRKVKEAKKARRVFDEINNIYTPKRYEPKMFPSANADPNGAYKEDLNNILCCPDCKEIPPNLVEEFSSGDMVCQSCGVVVGSRIIDNRSEWRTFANDDQNGDDPSRVGGPQDEFIEGQQLATTVAFSETKAHKALSRTQNNANSDKSQKNLMQGYKEIVSLCEAINMGQNVSNAAKHIFKLVDKHKFLRGKPQEVIIAGCIFVACRQNNVPRTFREIFNLTNVGKKEVGRVFKQLQQFLQKIRDEDVMEASTGLDTVTSYENTTTSAADLCGRYVSQLGFKQQQRITNLARAIAIEGQKDVRIGGRSPLSVAAACIYLVCHLVGEPRSSQPIALQAGVSDGTVKTAYKILYSLRDKLIKEEWLTDGASMDNIPVVQA
jgi:transcription initiation factor TFIIB